MWKSNEKNMGYIFLVLTFALFGRVRSVSCTGCYIHYKNIKTFYPKVFTWIALVAFSLICIYLLIVKQEWNLSFLLMCIAVAVGNVLDTKSR